MRVVITGLALAALVGLGACGDKASAVETRDRSADAGVSSAASTDTGSDASATEAPAKTVVTANRRETVDEKVQRLYERNGAAFGSRSPEDFLTKVTAFTSNPPADAERATRPNGDTLLYQASTNTFAVVKRDGTPRTMFKPDTGPAYWAEQKAAAPTFGQRRASN